MYWTDPNLFSGIDSEKIRAAVEEAPRRPEPRPAPKKDPDPWAEDRPPLPEEPPMMDEPGERVFDIPEEPPVRNAPPPAREAARPAPAVRPSIQEMERPAFRPAMAAVPAAPAAVREAPRSAPSIQEPERPAFRPAMAPVPAAPAQSEPPSGGAGLTGNWWRALAESCKGRLSPMYRVFLDKCTGVLEGEQVIVFAPDEITLSRIDNDRVRGILSEEVGKAAGHQMPLHLRVGEPPRKDPKENLQNLLAFASKHENIEIK